MNYYELLTSVMCQCVIILEDDFKPAECKKEKILYDFSRMALDQKSVYLNRIKEFYPVLYDQLFQFSTIMDEHFDDIDKWDDVVPRGDIVPAFDELGKSDPALKDALLTAYAAIDLNLLQQAQSISTIFGLGITIPNGFDSLFNEYLLSENRSKPIRIYTDFSAETRQLFEKDIHLASENNSIVCIIDNNLDGDNRAEEIIHVITNASQNGRQNIIGSIFSSKEHIERISNLLYFEFTPKGTPEQLKNSIAKSAYNYFIAKLQKETVTSLNIAFEQAVVNKDIAYYLSANAVNEGISEYEIILDWIKLLGTSQKKQSDIIKHLIILSRVINGLSDEDRVYNNELEDLNTFEAFDYTVNDYNLPIASGDIFTNDQGQWFVLIGQDCDMMRRGNGSRPKNTVAELLPAIVKPQSDIQKVAFDLENVAVNNFKKSLAEPSEILQISYRKREFISNEIINLCMFNSDGKCHLPLNKGLPLETKLLLRHHLIDYYKELQSYFKSVKVLRENMKQEFDQVVNEAFSPRAISLNDGDFIKETVNFNLRRVCRLTHSYVFYLYKLYLEYRGRQPFESINLVQRVEMSWPIIKNGEPTDKLLNFICILSPKILSPKGRYHQMEWVVKSHEFNRVLKSFEVESDCKEDIHLSNLENAFDFNNKHIVIKKIKRGHVSIQIT